MPLLSKDRSCEWVIDSLDQMRRNLNIAIWAYVIMPEHVHLLLYPQSQNYEMRRILAAMKAPVSKKAKEYLTENQEKDWLKRLTAKHGTRETFRFWQPGGGYDGNLWNSQTILEVIDYIHANPVRRGLVERPTDWKWSSAAAHAGTGPGPLKIDPVTIN